MHADNLHALRQTCKRYSNGTRHPVGGLRRIADGSNKAFARRAQQNRHAETVKQAEPRKQCQVMRLRFGKPDARPHRRMGVVLASGANLEEARQRADQAAAAITVLPGG